MAQSAVALGLIFSITWFLFAIPSGVFLVMAYTRSRMSGFLWLFCALVVWPAVSRLFSIALSVAGTALFVRGSASPGVSEFVVIQIVETLIAGILLLTSAIILYRQIVARTPEPATLPPPPTSIPR